MKTFFIYLLAFIFYMTGYISVILTANLKGFEWWYILIIIGTCFIIIPAILWWCNYFENLFKH